MIADAPNGLWFMHSARRALSSLFRILKHASHPQDNYHLHSNRKLVWIAVWSKLSPNLRGQTPNIHFFWEGLQFIVGFEALNLIFTNRLLVTLLLFNIGPQSSEISAKRNDCSGQSGKEKLAGPRKPNIAITTPSPTIHHGLVTHERTKQRPGLKLSTCTLHHNFRARRSSYELVVSRRKYWNNDDISSQCISCFPSQGDWHWDEMTALK